MEFINFSLMREIKSHGIRFFISLSRPQNESFLSGGDTALAESEWWVALRATFCDLLLGPRQEAVRARAPQGRIRVSAEPRWCGRVLVWTRAGVDARWCGRVPREGQPSTGGPAAPLQSHGGHPRAGGGGRAGGRRHGLHKGIRCCVFCLPILCRGRGLGVGGTQGPEVPASPSSPGRGCKDPTE